MRQNKSNNVILLITLSEYIWDFSHAELDPNENLFLQYTSVCNTGETIGVYENVICEGSLY